MQSAFQKLPMMISKAKIKYIKSLEQKKFRRQFGCFVAEGPKIVGELLHTMLPRLIVAESSWMESYYEKSLKAVAPTTVSSPELLEVSHEELRKLSFLQHPQEVLAVFATPTCSEQEAIGQARQGLTLALDGVQAPGNLGTILRIADWFGIQTIFCSPSTADIYSPKAVQATMGSIARVQTFYMDLPALFENLPSSIPIYGTFLDGHDIYETTLSDNGIIIMGNEGNGISDEVAGFVSHRLLIPNYPSGNITAESLNVAVATALTCAEFRRRRK